MSPSNTPSSKGRGSSLRIPNRFGQIFAESDAEHFEFSADDDDQFDRVKTTVTADASRSIISENNSPDIPFRYSLNPYRGCEHGCSYCYARPTHEYLGLNAGIDFESQIFVKHEAAALFRTWLSKRDRSGDVVVFSGVTDCYQPLEREYRLTRDCLETALDARQPVSIVTKNALVVRDLDILKPLADRDLIQVFLSINSLDEALARVMEPRTSSPKARLRAVNDLSKAGVPTGVMVAPVIPGLNDSEIPAVLQAARDAGARSASYVLLRLPLTVRPVFLDWLKEKLPTRAVRVESLVRSTRGGTMNDSQFGSRMRGQGEIAGQIRQTFRLFARKYNLEQRPIRPREEIPDDGSATSQLRLF